MRYLFWIVCICLSCSIYAQDFTLADTVKANALFLEATEHLKTKEFLLARAKAEQSKKINEQLFGVQSLPYARNLHQFGEIYYYEGNYDQAAAIWKQALSIREKKLSSDDLMIGDLYNNIGLAYHFNGNYNEAIQYLKKGLAIRKKNYGEEHKEVAKSYNNLSISYRQLNDLDKCIELNEKALAIHLKVSGENDLFVSNTYDIIGNAYNDKGSYNEGIKYHRKALAIRINLYGEKHSSVAASYNNIGLSYDYLGDYSEAYFYLKKAVELRKAILGSNHPDVGQSLMNLGTNRLYSGNYNEAIRIYSEALKIYDKMMGPENIYSGQLYVNIAIGYQGKGDFDKAIEYSKISMNILTKFIGTKHPFITVIYHTISTSYYYKTDLENAYKFARKSLQLKKELHGLNHVEVGVSYMNLSGILMDLREYGQAIKTLDTARNVLINSLPEDHRNIALLYGNMGNYFYLIHELDNSENYYRKAIDIHLSTIGLKHPAVAKLYNSLANIYIYRGLFLEASTYYDKVFEALNYNDTSSFSEVNSIEELIYTFIKVTQSRIKWFKVSGDSSHLYAAKKAYHDGINALDYQLKNISTKSKENYFSNHSYKLIEAGINTNLLLYQNTDSLNYLSNSFSLAERSKGFLLYEAMQSSEALQFAGIPDSLLQKEYNLRVDISHFDKKRQEKLNAGFSETDSTVLEVSSTLFDLNLAYEALKEQLESNYPKYYNAKYNVSAISLVEVQNNVLQPDQSLLEYTVGDSSIFIFLVRKDTFLVKEVKRDFPLDDLVTKMTKEGIYGYHALPQSQRTFSLEEQSITNYTSAALQLYQKLIAPMEDQLTEKLIIIPDGVLGYVPFEALLTATPPRKGIFRAYPYLLHQYQISYCYSATLLQEMQQKQHRQEPSRQLLAMAPFFRDDVQALLSRLDSTETLLGVSLRDSLNALKSSGEEIAQISKIWKGQPIFGSDASLSEFQQHASDYRLLHLSTHGKADDRIGDYAFLAFGVPGEQEAFDKLYARDLYNYSLNADMVVLSACETGIGKLQKGEGIISLARAFAYAGAKSIFNTLWKVDDATTKDLVVFFYANLRKGQAKDAALRNAKLRYLKKNSGDAKALHPFFWSGMIGIGDMSPIR